jgi:hypothetical protein
LKNTTQDVGISSTPTGAQVSVDNMPLGTTPIVSKLSRKDNHIIKINLAGYQPYETTITRTISGWVWGNLLFGGLIGLAVDAVSGGLYKLTPEQVSGSLSAGNTAIVPSKEGVYVVVVLKPDESWTKIDQLTRG